jgi:hypothetical protein
LGQATDKFKTLLGAIRRFESLRVARCPGDSRLDRGRCDRVRSRAVARIWRQESGGASHPSLAAGLPLWRPFGWPARGHCLCFRGRAAQRRGQRRSADVATLGRVCRSIRPQVSVWTSSALCHFTATKQYPSKSSSNVDLVEHEHGQSSVSAGGVIVINGHSAEAGDFFRPVDVELGADQYLRVCLPTPKKEQPQPVPV